MPFVIKNKLTAQLFSCELINIYSIKYIGVKNWEFREEAEREMDAFLQMHGVEAVSDWELFELNEHQMKMCNVKLGNNAKKRVYITELGTLETK